MIKLAYKYLIIILLPLFFASCEDVVEIDIREGETQLVVDAWITDELKEQKVILNLSQPYFENTSFKPAVGAEVKLILENKDEIVFKDSNNDGIYTFTPNEKDLIKLNQRVLLNIKYDGQEYISFSQMKRVPAIDSLTYEEFSFPITPPGGIKDGFLAQFFANDIVGEGDTYLIRSYKNDTLRFKPSDIGLAWDAGFSPGSKTDGLMFILPIRQSINPILFVDKDKLKVEILSIPNDIYFYILSLRQESTNGGIFATPSGNIKGNIINVNGDKGPQALGSFICSKVSVFETVIDKAKAKPKQ
jgi:hypothetical protein